ncbi:hypothetical protein Tco_0121110 [Tanacetum coccineum]
MYLNLFHTRSLKQRLSLLGKRVEAMPKGAWTEKDQIDNFLKERRILSLARNLVRRFFLNWNLPDHTVVSSRIQSIKVKEFQRSFRHSDTEHLSRSDEVLKLKNFKKDATLKLSKSTNQECAQDHIPLTSKDKGTPGQVTIQSDFFFNKDLEYLRYGRKSGIPALSISKIKRPIILMLYGALFFGAWSNVSKVANWVDVIERFYRRLSSWKSKSLSIGGRLTLTKSVLGSLPLYYLSLYRASAKVLKCLKISGYVSFGVIRMKKDARRGLDGKNSYLYSKKEAWVLATYGQKIMLSMASGGGDSIPSQMYYGASSLSVFVEKMGFTFGHRDKRKKVIVWSSILQHWQCN